MGWLYVPGLEGLSSESSSYSETPIELWVTSSGTPMQRPLSWRGWKTRPWIGRLFGTISRPLAAARGVDAWISSLPGIPVSPSAPPAVGLERTIPATYGLTWPGWSERYDHTPSSARTLTLTFDWDSSKSEESYASLVTRLRRDCSLRLKLARATFGNGSSSLLWTAEEGGEAWATPDAAVSTRTNRGGSNGRVGRDRPLLARMVQLWPTPNVPNGGRSPLGGTMTTTGQTPDGKKRQVGLEWRAEKQWRTPSDDSKRGGAALAESRLAQGHTLNLQDQARSFHPDPMPSTNGGSSTRRLNPRFVEWLMGWPIGWTASEPVGMEWSRWWQLWRSLLFGPRITGEPHDR